MVQCLYGNLFFQPCNFLALQAVGHTMNINTRFCAGGSHFRDNQCIYCFLFHMAAALTLAVQGSRCSHISFVIPCKGCTGVEVTQCCRIKLLAQSFI